MSITTFQFIGDGVSSMFFIPEVFLSVDTVSVTGGTVPVLTSEINSGYVYLKAAGVAYAPMVGAKVVISVVSVDIAEDVQSARIGALEVAVGLLPVAYSKLVEVLVQEDNFPLTPIVVPPDGPQFVLPPRTLHALSAVSINTGHVTLWLKPGSDALTWVPENPIFVMIPTVFPGLITVVNDTGRTIHICNTAFQTIFDWAGKSLDILPNTEQSISYSSTPSILRTYQKTASIPGPVQSVVAFNPGTILNNTTLGQALRVNKGFIKLGAVVSEGSNSDKALTITAVIKTVGYSGVSEISRYSKTLPANRYGETNVVDWTYVSGVMDQGTGVFVEVGTRIEFIAVYSSAPTTPVTNLNIGAWFIPYHPDATTVQVLVP